MNYSIRQLTAFVSVAGIGSFTGASKVMHLTQGAVSLLIKELEDALGLKLFDRTSRSVRLTPSGEAFLPFANKIIDDLHRANRYVMDLRNLKGAVVNIAAAPLISCTLLPRMILEFHKTHPEIKVVPIDLPMAQVQQSVMDGHTELGLGPEREIIDGVRCENLFSTPVSIICRPDHRFVGKRNTWADLGSESLIVVGYESIDYISISLGRQVPLNVAMVVNHMATALSMAAVGTGVVLAGSFVRKLASSYGLVLAELEMPVLNRVFEIYLREGRSLSLGAATFAAFMHHFVASNDPNDL